MKIMKLVVDLLGSDLGIDELIDGVVNFKNKNPNVDIVAVGDIAKMAKLNGLAELVNATDVVPMEAGPLEVMRKKDSSMYRAIELVKQGKGDAVISAGSTGGFLSASTLILKNAENVKRAALVAPFPTKIKGKKVVILDIGASNENSPEELFQFALMGETYTKNVLGVEKPNIYLLSNGTEIGKGSPTGKQAYKLLEKLPNFKGNIEARNVLSGEADVVVTDGFTGNVLLKSTEGVAKMMSNMIKTIFKKNLWTKLGYLHVRKGMKDMSETMDYKSTGGAILLGINGVVVKAHGNSNAYAFECALNVAKKMVESHIVNDISNGIKENG